MNGFPRGMVPGGGWCFFGEMDMAMAMEDQSVRTGKDDFACQIQDLVVTAHRMHGFKAANDYHAFEEACGAVGIIGEIQSLPAARFYWDRMTGTKTDRPLMEVRDNSGLSDALGIQLNGRDAPRNRLLYHLFEALFPGLFRAEIVDGVHKGGKEGKKRRVGNRWVHPEGLRRVRMYDRRPNKHDAWNIPLYSLFQGKHPADFIASHVKRKSEPLVAALGERHGLKLGQLLYDLQMILPDAATSTLLRTVLEKGMSGEEIVIVGAFCPDYAYEETGDPNLPYRYTFEGLGTGVGLVAQQFGRVIPSLSRFFTGMGVRHKIVLGIGDFEADSEAVLRRVKCDRETFVDRCRRSLEAFSRLPGIDGLPLTLELCDADRCNGRLRPYADEATDSMVRGEFGRMVDVFGDPERLVDQIVRDNGTFYQRWYSGISEADIRRKVLEQGGEYAALSRIYAEDFGEGNVIVVSGDRPMMHAFDNVSVLLPTLCVKRAY